MKHSNKIFSSDNKPVAAPLIPPSFHPNQLLSLPDVTDYTGKSRSKVYEDIEAGLFPHPVHLSVRRVAWPASELANLNRARIAGLPDSEIRKLVAELEAARALSRE